MGWNICLAANSNHLKISYLESLGDSASEEDYELAHQEIISLSRSFSYELFRDDGPLRKCLTDSDIALLDLYDIEDSAGWQCQDPESLLAFFYKLKERLTQENAQMPVDHFLFLVDETGKHWGGATIITLPFNDVELKAPHEPMMKLDGGHRNLAHRSELRMYDVRIDPELLTQHDHEMKKLLNKQNITDSQNGLIVYGNSVKTNPIVEEPTGWFPVKPVLNVLGCRVDVASTDALSSLGSDLSTKLLNIANSSSA